MIGLEVAFEFNLPSEMMSENTDSMVDEIVDRAAEMARNEWVRLAQERLTTTQDDYINNIQAVQRPSTNEASITLTGELPNMQEQGADPYDMKPGLLQNAKISKKGVAYKTIPFAHGSPTQGIIPKLPQAIFEEASRMAFGQRFTDKNKKSSWTGYRHTTGIYDKMKRTRPAGEGLTEFSSFRTVSANSNATSWIHPGFKALNLTEEVKTYLDSQIDSIIREVVGNMQ